MNSKEFKTPVLFIVFNRPDTTLRVLKAIEKVRPEFLYVAADGSRVNNTQDIENCNKVKAIIEQEITWNCEIKKLYHSQNLGCRNAVSAAINWFFDNVDEGIILEDDTVPNDSFFYFVSSMLERFRTNEKIRHITGSNFQKKSKKNQGSYLSKYPQIWGWGTWKRAWQKYDVNMADWPSFKNTKQFESWCFNAVEKNYWTQLLDGVYTGKIDTWDYQWLFAIVKYNGLCVVPAVNLVCNIGFNDQATHTKMYDNKFAALKTYKYIIVDNEKNLRYDKKADISTFNNIYAPNQNERTNKVNILLSKLRHQVKNIYKFLQS